MSSSSIWPIYQVLPLQTLSGATTPEQNGSGSNGYERIVCISQSSSITEVSISDCLVSYQGHLLGGGSYPSVETQSVYFMVSADWASFFWYYFGLLLEKILFQSCGFTFTFTFLDMSRSFRVQSPKFVICCCFSSHFCFPVFIVFLFDLWFPLLF